MDGKLSTDILARVVQLTAYERTILEPEIPLDHKEALKRFFLIWTLKEAYTKALGLGLGFDFKRIEYDVLRDVVRIDNVVPKGWQFVRFDLQRNEDTYVGVVAQCVGEDSSMGDECVVEHRQPGDWIQVYEPVAFMKQVIDTLKV